MRKSQPVAPYWSCTKSLRQAEDQNFSLDEETAGQTGTNLKRVKFRMEQNLNLPNARQNFFCLTSFVRSKLYWEFLCLRGSFTWLCAVSSVMFPFLAYLIFSKSTCTTPDYARHFRSPKHADLDVSKLFMLQFFMFEKPEKVLSSGNTSAKNQDVQKQFSTHCFLVCL